MTGEPGRTSAEWLRLRQPADAAARARDLVDEVRSDLSGGDSLVIHDLGCGSGSVARWLAGQLPGPQRWVMHDRDEELLALATTHLPDRSRDGGSVEVETRCSDVSRLEPELLAEADLITASALLDVLTSDQLGRLVALSTGPRCPVLIMLTVTGRVAISPADPLDHHLAAAFNSHQRRNTDKGGLMGPGAVRAAREDFERRGFHVITKPSPWRLGPDQAALMSRWLTGWVAAACEQQPALDAEARAYLRRRLADVELGRLSVIVDHEDLLARPSTR